jgi:hypothetical protein
MRCIFSLLQKLFNHLKKQSSSCKKSKDTIRKDVINNLRESSENVYEIKTYIDQQKNLCTTQEELVKSIIKKINGVMCCINDYAKNYYNNINRSVSANATCDIRNMFVSIWNKITEDSRVTKTSRVTKITKTSDDLKASKAVMLANASTKSLDPNHNFFFDYFIGHLMQLKELQKKYKSKNGKNETHNEIISWIKFVVNEKNVKCNDTTYNSIYVDIAMICLSIYNILNDRYKTQSKIKYPSMREFSIEIIEILIEFLNTTPLPPNTKIYKTSNHEKEIISDLSQTNSIYLYGPQNLFGGKYIMH